MAQATIERNYKKDFCENKSAANGSDLVSFAEDKHFVLIKGFLNSTMGLESLSLYFLDAENTYQKLAGQEQVTNLNVRSYDSVEKNATRLCRKLEAIALRRYDRKLIVLGHSMGGAVASMIPVHCPQLLEQRVSAVVAINSVIKGTPVADILYQEEDKKRLEEYRQTLRGQESVLQSLTELVIKAIKLPTNAGFRSLTTKESMKRFDKIINLPESVRMLSHEKTFFVSSKISHEKLGIISSATGKLIYDEYGYENDGRVPLQSQYDDRIGTHLMQVNESNHGDLVVASISPKSNSHCRKTFSLELLRELIRNGIR